MTPLQAPASSRRRLAPMAGAFVVLAVLASCSTAARTPAAKSNRGISIASRVIPPPPKPCAVSPILVNSCRPWLGAAAAGNPGAPGSKIAQFQYLEKLVGHHLDIFRDYDAPPGSGALGVLPLNPNELYFARQPGTYVDVNWKPVTRWVLADGGDPAVNAEIRKVADNIRAVAPHKVFLTIWWEPQNDVSGGTSCPGLVGSAGTPAQYKLMWQNVESIFRAQGTDNVVWAMDYQSDPKWNCLVPQLWPGNSLVDWVLYDSYDHDKMARRSGWYDTAGRFYHTLEQDSSPSVDFDAKPWGLGEFGTCGNPSALNSQQYFLQAKQAIESDAYPRLKMYVIYADTGNHSGPACLTDYDSSGQPDAAKNSAFKALISLPVFNR